MTEGPKRDYPHGPQRVIFDNGGEPVGVQYAAGRAARGLVRRSFTVRVAAEQRLLTLAAMMRAIRGASITVNGMLTHIAENGRILDKGGYIPRGWLVCPPLTREQREHLLPVRGMPEEPPENNGGSDDPS